MCWRVMWLLSKLWSAYDERDNGATENDRQERGGKERFCYSMDNLHFTFFFLFPLLRQARNPLDMSWFDRQGQRTKERRENRTIETKT